MTIAAKICEMGALQNNVHEAKVYGPKDIDPKFRKANAAILDQPRGCGYWLWKPYLIEKELKKMKDGDVLIYCDAGVEIVSNINYIIDRMTDDLFLFGNMWQHVHFCKADVMKAINCWDSGNQVQASVIVIRNSQKAKGFVNEWHTWCTVAGMIDDSPSKCPNHPEFQEHRHDQAVLTTLAYREKIAPFHWWPAMYNAGHFTYEKTGYTDTYPVLFHHHRMRNNDFSATDDLNRHMQRYFRSKYNITGD
jgi:hypothetical protein